jgi:hypothetical protein
MASRGGDVFKSFCLHRLHGDLLGEPLHPLSGNRFAWACHSDRITIDRAVGRIGQEVERAAGEVERISGTLTATESVADVAVERDVWEPVRRREEAKCGRLTRIVWLAVGCWHRCVLELI